MPRPKENEKTDEPRLTAYIAMNLEPITKRSIETLAAQEQRTLGQMGRILIKEALRSRGALPEPEPSAA